MHLFTALFISGIVWGWPMAVESVDCRDTASVQREKNTCLTKFGLSTDTDVDQVQNELKKNLSATCRDIDKYKAALSCALEIDRNCLENTGGDPNIRADGQKLSEGLTYLCDNAKDVDTACYNQVEQSILLCVGGRVQAEFSANTEQDATTVTCRSFEFSIDCMNKKLSACSAKTKEIYVTYTKYVIPPACDGAPFLKARSFWVLAMAALMALVFGSSLDC